VLGTESEIRDALINLIFNAIDAMPGGGTLTVSTQVTPTSVILKIIDTGIGMDEETRQRCLEPFYTTKGKRGTGLGLAMVYGVLQRHDARIDIASGRGCGTTIQMIFPLPPSVSGNESPYGIGAGVAPPPLRILVVDDDPLVRESLHDILRKDSHEVVVADGGDAGIAAFLAAQEEHAFDVVITDLGMPKTDGREVARRVKHTSPATPVVLLTGWGRRMLDDGDVPPHVDYLLSKPLAIEDLRKTLVFVSVRDEEERIANGLA
jgi:CheY-like chemotaxis protein